MVLRAHGIAGIRRHCGRWWHVRQWCAVRPPEAELSVRLSFDLKAFFVDRSMVSPTQHREIRQLRGAAMRPVPNVMALSERQSATWEATAFVTMLQRAP